VENGSEIEMELVKLASGERVLRLTHPGAGFCLEKKLDPVQPVALQRDRLLTIFEAALSRAEAGAA